MDLMNLPRTFDARLRLRELALGLEPILASSLPPGYVAVLVVAEPGVAEHFAMATNIADAAELLALMRAVIDTPTVAVPHG